MVISGCAKQTNIILHLAEVEALTFVDTTLSYTAELDFALHELRHEMYISRETSSGRALVLWEGLGKVVAEGRTRS